MKLPATRTLAALCAMLAVAGMSEGCNKKRTLNQFFSDSRGTGARDAVDADDGQDSRLYGITGFSSSASIEGNFPVGPSGEVVTHVTRSQPQETIFDVGFGTLAFTHVIGDAIGSANELGDHQDPSYSANYDGRRAQSYNKRFVSLLQTSAGSSSDDITVTVFDTQTGRYGRPVSIIGASGIDFGSSVSLQVQVVDNTGKVTVIFKANERTSGGTATSSTDDHIWVCQVDGVTGTIVRQPTIISKGFASTGSSSNGSSLQDVAAAINGDIAIAYLHTEAGGVTTTTLQTVVYDRSTDTFRASVRSDNGVNHTVSQEIANVAVETDGRSFQLAFTQPVSSTANFSGVYTSRFVAGASTGFGTASRIDAVDGNNTFLNSFYAPKINFGRDSTSIVDFQVNDASLDPFGDVRTHASWSDETVTPTAANTVRLTDDLSDSAFDDSTPAYAFQDDGSAILVRVCNNGTGNDLIQVNLLDASVATPRITTVSATFNIATEVPGTGARDVTGVGLSGFASGDNATCVIAWQSRDSVSSSQRVNAALVSDLSVGARTQLSLETETRTAIFDFQMCSLNDVQTLSSYPRQFDQFIDPLTAPAAGTGAVWVAWTQRKPNAAGTARTNRAFVWNYNPAVSTTTLGGSSTVLHFGADGAEASSAATKYVEVEAFEGIYPATDGSATLMYRHNALVFRTTFNPAGSLTSAATAGTPTLVLPEDMEQERFDARGIHIDGFGFGYSTNDDGNTVDGSLHGGRLWTFFNGRDVLSNRVFAIRSR